MKIVSEVFIVLLSLIAPYFLGHVLTRLVLKKDNVLYSLEGVFYKWGLGMGAITLYMFLLSLLKIPFNFFNLIGPCILLTILQFPSWKTVRLEQHEKVISKGWDKFIWGFVAFNLLMIFIRTMLAEDNIWDNWAFWAFKARVYFYHHMIPLDKFEQFKTVWGNWDYPQHIPLMQVWVSEWLGYWNDYWLRILYFLYFSGIGCLSYFSLRRLWGNRAGLLAVFFLSSLIFLHQVTIGIITEPVLLFYYVGGFLLLLRAVKENDIRLLVYAAIFSGLAAWVKNEGQVLILSNAVVLLLCEMTFGKKIKWIAIFGFTSFLINMPWIVTKHLLGLSNFLLNDQYFNTTVFFHNISHLGSFLIAQMRLMLNVEVYNMAWLLFLYCLVKKVLDKQQVYQGGLFLWSILIQMGIYDFLFFIFPHSNRYLTDTLPRLLLAPTILSFFYSSIILSRLSSKKIKLTT
jgi:4-amino-4-deoxy-L-arabinose transferase-like glycosyltransferase